MISGEERMRFNSIWTPRDHRSRTRKPKLHDRFQLSLLLRIYLVLCSKFVVSSSKSLCSLSYLLVPLVLSPVLSLLRLRCLSSSVLSSFRICVHLVDFYRSSSRHASRQILFSSFAKDPLTRFPSLSTSSHKREKKYLLRKCRVRNVSNERHYEEIRKRLK